MIEPKGEEVMRTFDLFTYFPFAGKFRFIAKWDRHCGSYGTCALLVASEVGAVLWD